jgi:predicted signal transduction protein with EAL and GGDEF domain
VGPLYLSEQRQLRCDRAELDEFRALGLDCLEHAPERRVSFASIAARLEARRQCGGGFMRACRGLDELSSPIDGPQRPTTLDDLIEVDWRLRERAAS